MLCATLALIYKHVVGTLLLWLPASVLVHFPTQIMSGLFIALSNTLSVCSFARCALLSYFCDTLVTYMYLVHCYLFLLVVYYYTRHVCPFSYGLCHRFAGQHDGDEPHVIADYCYL